MEAYVLMNPIISIACIKTMNSYYSACIQNIFAQFKRKHLYTQCMALINKGRSVALFSGN